MQNPNPYAGGPQGMARRAGMPGQPGYPGGLNVGPNLANRANVPSPIVVSPFGGQQLPLNEMQAQLAARRSGVQMGPNGMPLSPGGNGMMPGSAGGALPGSPGIFIPNVTNWDDALAALHKGRETEVAMQAEQQRAQSDQYNVGGGGGCCLVA